MESRMMERNMMHGMTGMADQMNAMLRRMSESNMTDLHSANDMSAIMNKMSIAMRGMAEQMSSGIFHSDTIQNLHRRMNHVSGMMGDMNATMRIR